MEVLEGADLDNHIVEAADRTIGQGVEDVHNLPMAVDQMADSKTYVYRIRL